MNPSPASTLRSRTNPRAASTSSTSSSNLKTASRRDPDDGRASHSRDTGASLASSTTTLDLSNPWASLNSLASSIVNSVSGGTSAPELPQPQRQRRRRPGPPQKKKKGWFADLIAPLEEEPPVTPSWGRSMASPPLTPVVASSQRERDGEGAALVYIFPVRENSTIEGVAIAFDTTTDAVRKANGLWPGDTLHTRAELLVPVDGCGVKGTLVRRLEDGTTPKDEEEADGEEKEYHPVSITSIPSIGEITIARLARKQLSYFPPRRKPRRSSRSFSLSLSRTSPDLTTPLSPPPIDADPLSQPQPSPLRPPAGANLLPFNPGVGSLHEPLPGGSGGQDFGRMLEGVAQETGKAVEVVGGWVRNVQRRMKEAEMERERERGFEMVGFDEVDGVGLGRRGRENGEVPSVEGLGVVDGKGSARDGVVGPRRRREV